MPRRGSGHRGVGSACGWPFNPGRSGAWAGPLGTCARREPDCAGRLWKYVFGYLDVRAESYAEKPRSRKRRRAGFWARARRRTFPVFPTMMRNLSIRAQEGEQMDSPDLPEPVYREVLGGLRRLNSATSANRPTPD